MGYNPVTKYHGHPSRVNFPGCKKPHLSVKVVVKIRPTSLWLCVVEIALKENQRDRDRKEQLKDPRETSPCKFG